MQEVFLFFFPNLSSVPQVADAVTATL